MLEAHYISAVRDVAEFLSEFAQVRSLTGEDLRMYNGQFEVGWQVPELCPDDRNLKLRVLLSKAVPFEAPRIAVAPAPRLLTWPHLEDQGLLCLLPETANFSIDAPAAVVRELLTEAQKLVHASMTGENVEDFEDEFESYWARWERTRGDVIAVCQPKGPSRLVSIWHSNQGTYIAENEPMLRAWIGNRHSKEIAKKATIQSTVLLWLPRPLRPIEYPRNLGMLRALHHAPTALAMLDEVFLELKTTHKLVLLGFNGRRGAGFAAVSVRMPEGIKNGFRKTPPINVLQARYNAASVDGSTVTRYDESWVHGRDHNSDLSVLTTRSVVIVGTGSLGSTVAEFFAKAGIGRISLIDEEKFESSNTSRHVLGAPAVDKMKATKTARELAARFPHLTFNAFPESLSNISERTPEVLRDANLVVCTTGDWPSESLLNALFLEDHTFPPIIYGWLEPHAVAGHALAIFHEKACVRCLLDELGPKPA